MIKTYCDNPECKAEINDNTFRFEGIVVEIKQKFQKNGALTPEVIKKQIHLCQACYKKKIDL